MFFHSGSTFRTVKLRTEEEFEGILLTLQSQIFPNFFLFETKTTAYTPYGEKTHLDMCLISKSCEQWFIIEVELQKGDYYSKSHIRNQLSKQVEADWTTLITEMQDKLKKLGLKRRVYSRLERVDWGNILIIDKTSDAVSRVCQEYGVIELEITTLMNQRGEYSLFMKDSKALPNYFSNKENIINVPSRNIPCIAGILYIELPIKLIEEIGSYGGQIKVIIDGEIMSTRPNLMGKLEIPVNLLKSNCLTKKLARRVVDAGIETRVEHEELILEITELDNW